MGGCCSSKGDNSFPRAEGRKVNRTITDFQCLVVFLVFMGLLVLNVFSGLWYGDINRLTHGSDWEGNICGISTGKEDMPFMMFCGSPERVGNFPKYILQGSTACVQTCPTDNTMTINCLMPPFHNFTSEKGGTIGGTIPDVETLSMTLTQSVTVQNAYPTEAWGGRFCLPSMENAPLRDLIINGPWGQYYRPLVSVGGLRDAWPLLLIAAGTASLLGWLYLFILQRCAGPIIFVTMVISTLFTLALGIFFFWALVMDMEDPDTDYAKFSPIMSVYVGDQAKVISIIVGVIIIIFGVLLGVVTMTSLQHIDDMIGVIDASREFLAKDSCTVKLFPVIQSAAFFLFMIIACLVGLPLVESLGRLDYSEIEINGVSYTGLSRVYKKDWYQHVQLWYYVIGVIYLIEMFVQIGHYMIAYTAATWYFNGGTESDAPPPKSIADIIAKDGGKKMNVRVGGVDANYGPRQAAVVEYAGYGKVLIAPVGKKGPGLGRNDNVLVSFSKNAVPMLALTEGGISVFFCHLGSIALGAPVIFIYRPFRFFAQFVSALLARTSDPSKGVAYADDPHTANVRGCLALFSACLEQVFGKYSKTAFTELVLNGESGFFDCSDRAFTFLVESGGSIAHLHGAMVVYEFFGALCITMFCGWMCMILQDEVDIFNEPTSEHYIEDKNTATIACSIIAFAISLSWMTLWNQSADVLLYCVAWNRRQCHLGEEHGVTPAIIEISETCPQALRSILPAYELDPAFEHGLHAHGIGQQGAILAAMEHGAMNVGPGGGGGGNPNYSKMVADTNTMATKIMG